MNVAEVTVELTAPLFCSNDSNTSQVDDNTSKNEDSWLGISKNTLFRLYVKLTYINARSHMTNVWPP